MPQLCSCLHHHAGLGQTVVFIWHRLTDSQNKALRYDYLSATQTMPKDTIATMKILCLTFSCLRQHVGHATSLFVRLD